VRFFERFREEITRYADGVHRLGAPAPEQLAAACPDAELGDFLRSWNGAELFVDAWRILPAAEHVEDGGFLWFGETGLGDRLGIDLQHGGHVVRLENDTGELLVEGTSFERWIEGLAAAESVIYDREGEYQEDVYEGEAIAPAAAVKREKKALRADPDAPAPAWRLARALEQSGDEGGARKRLETVVEKWPDFAWAWFDLGRLRRTVGWLDEAEKAFSAAAEAAARGASEQAGFFAAHAARVAAEREDEPARARLAARALALAPDEARSLRRAAQARADEDEPDEALELAELSLALAPRDLEAAELRRRLAAQVARPARRK
jgi:hypothetical protein